MPRAPQRGVAFSVKSQRILTQLGVTEAFDRGATVALAGPTYRLLADPSVRMRLAFLQDEEERLCVGYAREDGGAWNPVEMEPFSRRALGYYQRRLKRLGEYADTHARVGRR